MVDTTNDFLFSLVDGKVLRPALAPQFAINGIATREQAFRTAAWIALMGEVLPSESESPEVEFEDVYKAIRNT